MAQLLVVVLAAVAIVIALRTTAAPAPAERLVLYVGHWTAASEAGFKNFKTLAAKLRKSPFDAVRLEFIRIPDDVAEASGILAKAIAQRPELVIAPSASSAKITRQVSPTVPVVFASYMEPIGYGIVDSLQRRSAPVTGIDLSDSLDGKRFEILKEAYPGVSSVAVLAHSEWTKDQQNVKRVNEAAARFGLKVQILDADSKEEVDRLFRRASSSRFDAWYVPASYLEDLALDVIISGLRRLGKPCIYSDSFDVDAGGLMSYMQDSSLVWPALVDLSVRVLDGAPPGAIPIVRPHRFELAVRINPDTGVQPPTETILRRADRLIR